MCYVCNTDLCSSNYYLIDFIYLIGYGTAVPGQFDRTISPSIASVTSGYSAASSVAGTGSLSKRLEWDTTADLRPGKHWGEDDDIIQNQKYAANQLEGLDKEVIESYSNYFQREDPEGKPSKKQGIGATGVSQGKSDMTK